MKEGEEVRVLYVDAAAGLCGLGQDAVGKRNDSPDQAFFVFTKPRIVFVLSGQKEDGARPAGSAEYSPQMPR
jgi:hypothetical protein